MKTLKSNEEILICPICYVRYRNDIEMTPHCLKCGHTFCKKCLISMKKGNGIKCGICQIETLLTVDNPIVENKAILNTLSLINCLDYTYRSINKFSFYHCDTCDMFISNYTINCHKAVFHKIISLNQYYYKNKHQFFYKSEHIFKKFAMFYVLNLFQSPDIIKKKKTNIKNVANSNNNFLSFYGEEFIQESDKDKSFEFLKYVLSENKVNSELTKIYKGVIIGKNSSIIQGYFLSTTQNKEITFVKGLGILTSQELTFFGLIDFVITPTISGYSLDYGIYTERSSLFYFGKFNKDIGEVPLFELLEGEKIDENVGKVTRRYYSPQLKKTIKSLETFYNNKYFTINTTSNSDLITFNLPKKTNEQTDTFEITINLSHKEKNVQFVKLKKNNEDIITIKNAHYFNTSCDQIKIEHNQIILHKNEVNMILLQNQVSNKPKILLFSTLTENSIITKGNIYGYIIEPKKETDCLNVIRQIVHYNIHDLYFNCESFIECCDKILNTQIKNCIIKYKKLNLNTLDDKGYSETSSSMTNNSEQEKYISFDYKKEEYLEVSVNYDNHKRGQSAVIELENEILIKDLLPSFYSSRALSGKKSKNKELIRMNSEITNQNYRSSVCYCKRKCLII